MTTRTQQPGQIWDAALGELQLQVARPAFETWLRDTDGVAHIPPSSPEQPGEFIVGTANAFVSEMLEHRMYPLIERAIEHVIGEPTSVRFQVAAASSATVNAPAEVPPLAAEGSEPASAISGGIRTGGQCSSPFAERTIHLRPLHRGQVQRAGARRGASGRG